MNVRNYPQQPVKQFSEKSPINRPGSLLLLCALLLSAISRAQLPTTAAYQFLPDTLGFMAFDRNGNTIDMTTEPYVISPGSQQVNSPVQALPFEVSLFGSTFTNFIINVNGCMVLAPSASISFTPSLANSFTSVNSQYMVLAPFWDVLTTPANKGIRYKVSGKEPYRSLTVEWFVKPQGPVTATDYDFHFQLRLYESTNIVEYVYGKMKVNAQLPNPVTASIGFSLSSASRDSSFISLLSTDSLTRTSLRSDLAASQSLVNRNTPGIVNGLHSETEGSRTRIAFVPEPILQPGNLSAFNITTNEALLYWDDNTTDETAFRTFRVRPDELTYDTTLGPNITFRTLTNLLPATTYQFRVQARNSYTTSFSNVVTFRTNDGDTLTAVNSGNWNDTATWGGSVPGRNTLVIIPAAYKVNLNVANAYCHQLLVDGTLEFADQSGAQKLNVNYDVINNGRISSYPDPTFNNTGNEIITGRSVINSGVMDLHHAPGSYTSAVTLRFIGDENARLTGNGDTTDLYGVICAKKGVKDSLSINPLHLTLRGANTDAWSGAALLTGAQHTGTLYIGGTFSLENRLLTGNAFSTAQGLSVILDNPNLVIVPATGDVTIQTSCAVTLAKGRLNITGSLVLANLATLTVSGGELNISNQLKNVSAAQGAFFNHTGGMVITNGLAMSAAANIINLQGGLLVSNGNSQLNANLTVSRFGNHTTQFGWSNGTAVKQFQVSGNYANLYIDSAINTPVVTTLTLNANMMVAGKLYVGSNDTIDVVSYTLNLSSDSVVLDGAIKNTSTGKLAFVSERNQVISGTGQVRVQTLEVAKEDTAASVRLAQQNLVQVMHLNLFGGKLIHSNRLMIGDSGMVSGVQIGRETGSAFGGSLDTFPVYANGAELLLYYHDEPAPRVTSFEIPESRKLHGVFFNNTKGVMLAGGNFEVTDTLVLKAGTVITALHQELIFTDTTNERALYAAEGAFIKGPFSRNIPASVVAEDIYRFPVGDVTANPFNLSNLKVSNEATRVRVTYSDGMVTGQPDADLTNLNASGFWQLAVLNNTAGFNQFATAIYHENLSALSQLAMTSSNAPALAATDVFKRAGQRVNYYTDSLQSVFISPSAVSDTFYYFTIAELVPDTFTKGTYTIGEGKDFETLTQVARKLSTTYIDSVVVFEITREYSNANEQFPIGFEQMLYTNNNHPKKVYIRLAENVTNIVTANVNGPVLAGHGLIEFYGADSLVLNGAGSDGLGLPTNINEWTIRTAAGTAQTPVIRFANNASYNTITALNITGNNNSAISGTILLDHNEKDLTGNDANTIEHNTITSESSAQLSYNHIFSAGSDTYVRNDGTRIRNNRIADFSGRGVNVETGGAGFNWNIEANDFYQTFSSSNNVIPVNFTPGLGSGLHLIKGNVIGGSQPQAEGTAWTFTAAGYFNAMMLAIDDSLSMTVSDNSIKNFNLTSNSTVSGFRGMIVTSGNVKLVANKIGGQETWEAITIAGRGLTSLIQANNNAGKITISDNILGNINQSVSAGTTNLVRGISLEGTGAAELSNNTIASITARGSSTDYRNASLVGIYVGAASSSVTITGNKLYDLNMAYLGCVTGISVNSGAQGTISRNYLYNLTNTSTTSVRYIMGMSINDGSWMISNNKIVITNDVPSTSVPVAIQALRIASASPNTISVLHNTVYVGGSTTATSVSSSASYAYVQAVANINAEVNNNIFVNTRATSATIHMAAYFVASPLTRSDFNVFYSPQVNTISLSGVASSFATFRNTTGGDEHSVAGKLPVLKNLPANLVPADTIANCFLKGMGTETEVAGDFADVVRNRTQPDPGADEFIYTTDQVPAPVLLSGNDTLCGGLPRTLYMPFPLPGAETEWYDQPSGGNLLFTGVDFTTGPLDQDTVFYAQVRSGECTSYRTAVTVKVKPAPLAKIVNAPVGSVCGGNSLTIEAKAAPGVSVNWFTDSIGGTPIATGLKLTTGILTGDTAFYAEASNGICAAKRTRVFIAVDNNNPLTTPVTDTLVQVCSENGLQLKASSIYNIAWYATPEGLPIGTDSIFEFDQVNNDTFLYVAATNGFCTSAKVKVQVNAVKQPELPLLDSMMQVCGNQPVLIETNVSADVVNWYTSEQEAVPFFQGATLSLPGLITDSTFYYEVANAVCPATARKSVSLITTLVAEPVVSPLASVCKNQVVTIDVLNAGNATTNWYTSASAATSIYEGISFATAPLAADTTFYVQFTEGGCTGQRVPVLVDVVEHAAPPALVSADSICKGNTAKVMVSSTQQVNWYATATSTEIISQDLEFNTGFIQADTVFYVAASYGNCMSERVAVRISLKAAPQPPLFTPVAPVCSGSSTTLHVTASDSVKWYNNTTSTNPLNRGTVFNTPKLTGATTYYVETDNGACKSNRVALMVPVQAAPQVPVMAEASYRTCYNEPVLLSAISSSAINWYASFTGSVLLQRDSMYLTGRLKTDTVFYAESFNGSCRSTRVAVPVSVLNYIGNVQISTPDSAILDEEISISSNGPLSSIYTWEFGSGASLSGASGQGPFLVSYNTPGEKDIRLIISRRSGNLNCDTVLIKHFHVVDTTVHTGLAREKEAFTSFTVYPNPATEKLNITFALQAPAAVTVQLCDATGRLVWEDRSEPASAYQHTVDINSFNSGLYILRVITSQAVQTRKVIIE